MEATDHEAQTNFQKKTQQHQVRMRLLDLEHSKTAVLNSLTSQDAQRGYRHAIDEFVDWYCSHSIELSFCATDLISKLFNSRLARSIYD
jgi:hypothetical protein